MRSDAATIQTAAGKLGTVTATRRQRPTEASAASTMPLSSPAVLTRTWASDA